MASATFASYLHTVDVDSAALILQLQLDDIDSLVSASKRKGRMGEINDQEIALRLCHEDLEASMGILQDRKMLKSIVHAQQTDHHVLSELAGQEELAANDRDLACRLDGRPTAPKPFDFRSTEKGSLDTELLAKLAALYVSKDYAVKVMTEDRDSAISVNLTPDDDDDETQVGESSTQGARSLVSKSSRSFSRECVACATKKEFFDIARAPCGDEYCGDCLDHLFLDSTKDESLYPPRCCRTPIPFALVRFVLDKEIAEEFMRKVPELETKDRTYCFVPTCSAWIHPDLIKHDVGRCPKCSLETCSLCKGKAHGLGECPKDEQTLQLLQLAEENHWQRCYQCRAMIEIDTGCYHMTCKCGAEWCYLCGMRWKDCTCQLFEEHHLLQRAENLVARGQRAQPGAGAADIYQRLMQHHECTDHRWTYVPGSHRCEACNFRLPQYIFECRHCMMRACNRCRRNRL
ncbi:uncharacterized protein IWZ02DRAFT_142882 [Phyllosticta citriasiana]|uniref:uncharacterized protein n=1 Tax=Phyllosticta citriasiana TaxID=595635 RepID=UPI0030FD71C4